MRAWALVIWIAPAVALATPPSGPAGRPPTAQRDHRLSRDTIDRVIRANAKAFRACFERELTRNPAAAEGGKIVVRFVIDKDGAVTSVRVESSTMKVRAIADCVVAQLRRTRFPASDASSSVTYPFLFSRAV